MDHSPKKQQLQQHLHWQCDNYIANLFAFALSPDSARLDQAKFLDQMQLIINLGTDAIQHTLNDAVQYLLSLHKERFSQSSAYPNVLFKTEGSEESATPTFTITNLGDTPQFVAATATSNNSKRKQSSSSDTLPDRPTKKKKVGIKVKVRKEWRLEVSWPKTRKCPIDPSCTEKFKSSNLVKKRAKHLKRVHKMEQFFCLVRHCIASFADQNELASHIEICHRTFACRACDEEFSHFDHLAAHFERCHERGTFACSHCDFTSTNNRDEVLRHQNILPPKPVFDGDEPLFGCPIEGCNYKAECELKVTRHQQGVHIMRSCI